MNIRVHPPLNERLGCIGDARGSNITHNLAVFHWAKMSGFYLKNADATRKDAIRLQSDRPARAEYLQQQLAYLS